jgi:hypothetical protein
VGEYFFLILYIQFNFCWTFAKRASRLFCTISSIEFDQFGASINFSKKRLFP